ncbi:class III lanthionine synthetase LanKC [Streptomyces sp. cg2]|uniref:class III lanthionine synthetase LanKC n=1 Tax=Streptomyces sp. cg2 TaxID=3238799 RepID=UPI0034E28E50
MPIIMITPGRDCGDLWGLIPMELAAFYLAHCLADPDFYDTAQRWDDSASRFTRAGAEPPGGWQRFEQGLWVLQLPPDHRLPEQGWKVHVSAGLDNAEEVLGVVWEHCVERRIAFKFLRSRQVLQLTNAKYADRGSSGKFCTIYPNSAEELSGALTELGDALDGRPGPYVLSDLRWRNGPLFVRYGAFQHRTCRGRNGEPVPALTDPRTGQLVPDLRGPAFRVPPWVEPPPFLTEAMAARNNGAGTFPYEVQKALHFSNAGGVYLATDPDTGRSVVLKEARPLAGLDTDGVDAVARLRHEHAILDQLAGLAVVPRVLGDFTCWEHHFLVQEYIEGETLTQAAAGRHPYTKPEPSAREIADFAAWAVEVVGKVRAALSAIHSRGVVVGDVHPSNILLRPDGSVVLVDFELALPIGAADRPTLGAPGFVPPEGCTGPAIDHYGLAATALWVFVSVAPVLQTGNPGKSELFLQVLADRFGVPEPFVAALRRDLRPRHETSGATADHVHQPVLQALGDPKPEDWPQLRRSIAEGILAAATPQRSDRLFPGDVEQFRTGGLNIAHGAAGVLLALAEAGLPPDPEHVDWLIRAVKRWDAPQPGFYDGLHGIAYVLDRLGHRVPALAVLDRAVDLTDAEPPLAGLHSGLAGMGLNLLHFGTADADCRHRALTVAGRLADAIRTGTLRPDRPTAAGLMFGSTGVALFFLHCFRATSDPEFLDLARAALHRDLADCETGPGDTLQVREQHRLMPHLGIGTAGMAPVLGELLRQCDDAQLAHAYERIRRTCRAESGIFPGLFTGHAGVLASLAATGSRPALDDPAVRTHLNRLSWYAEIRHGRLVFPGEQLYRLSTDLATGAAGVLLALTAVFDDRRDFLPFLPAGAATPRQTQTCDPAGPREERR